MHFLVRTENWQPQGCYCGGKVIIVFMDFPLRFQRKMLTESHLLLKWWNIICHDSWQSSHRCRKISKNILAAIAQKLRCETSYTVISHHWVMWFSCIFTFDEATQSKHKQAPDQTVWLRVEKDLGLIFRSYLVTMICLILYTVSVYSCCVGESEGLRGQDTVMTIYSSIQC